MSLGDIEIEVVEAPITFKIQETWPAGADGATWPAGADGADWLDGERGPKGEGIPQGGSTGEFLKKTWDGDYEVGFAPLINDTGWIVPTLLNGWVNFDWSHQWARYRRIGGVVYVQGLVKFGSSGIIFLLPEGFHPNNKLLHATVCNANAFCRIDVDPDGTIRLEWRYSNWWVSINMSFII